MRKSREDLINAIKEFFNELDEDVVQEFGGWNRAFDASGVISGVRTSYTDEEILNSLKEFYSDYGENISDYLYKKEGRKPYPRNIYKRFGTWNNALEKAGIPTKPPYRKIPEEEMLETLKRAYKDIGDPFTTTLYTEWAKETKSVTITPIVKSFGGWSRVKERLGIGVNGQ